VALRQQLHLERQQHQRLGHRVMQFTRQHRAPPPATAASLTEAAARRLSSALAMRLKPAADCSEVSIGSVGTASHKVSPIDANAKISRLARMRSSFLESEALCSMA
jgi:hypothetical protein